MKDMGKRTRASGLADCVSIPQAILQAFSTGGWDSDPDVVRAYEADQVKGMWVHPTLEAWLFDPERNKAVREQIASWQRETP